MKEESVLSGLIDLNKLDISNPEKTMLFCPKGLKNIAKGFISIMSKHDFDYIEVLRFTV